MIGQVLLHWCFHTFIWHELFKILPFAENAVHIMTKLSFDFKYLLSTQWNSSG